MCDDTQNLKKTKFNIFSDSKFLRRPFRYFFSKPNLFDTNPIPSKKLKSFGYLHPGLAVGRKDNNHFPVSGHNLIINSPIKFKQKHTYSLKFDIQQENLLQNPGATIKLIQWSFATQEEWAQMEWLSKLLNFIKQKIYQCKVYKLVEIHYNFVILLNFRNYALYIVY